MLTDITLTGGAGEYMDSATVVAWTVMPGTALRKGDIVAVVETAKAATEIEAPCDGVLTEQLAPIGTEVGVGGVIGRMVSSVGFDTPAAVMAAPPSVEPGALESRCTPASAPSPHPTERILASPLARRAAAGYGLELSRIEGTGPRGRIKSRDVERTLRTRQRGALDVIDSSQMGHHVGRRPVPTFRRDAPAPCPIVFIHGFGSGASGWNAILPRLASYPCMALDLPGHGRQTRAALGFDELVQSVLLDLEEADVTEVHLVGHSLGAAVAAALAATQAVLVRSLTLLAPAGLGPEINGAFLDGFLRADAPASLQPWLERLVADPDRLPAGFAATLLRERTRNDLGPAQTRLAQALFPRGTQSFTIRAGLAQVPCPIKVVAGSRDEIVPPAHARGLGGAVGVHILDGVGHMPHFEALDLVARLIAENCRAGG